MLAGQRYGSSGEETLRAWRMMIDAGKSLPEKEQLELVNAFFNNHVFFEDDKVVWQQPDYWATPLETLGAARAIARTTALAST